MKKLTKRIKYSTLSIMALSLTMIYGFNCSKTYVVENLDDKSSGGGVTQQSVVDYGVYLKSADAILQSMQRATGIETYTDASNPDDARIMSMFAQRVGALPASNDLMQMTGPMVVAATNLAATVCEKAVNLEASRAAANRLFFKTVDFDSGLSSVSRSSLNDVTSRMAISFWSRNITQAEQDAIAAEFIDMFPADLTSAQVQSTAETRNMGIAICTAMLSSFDALIME